MIERIDHFTVASDQLEMTRQFYVDLLGLTVGYRPAFPVQGLWLYAEKKPLLHLIQVCNMPTPRRGALDHMAFFATDLSRTLCLLGRHQVPFRIIRCPGQVRTWQVFFYDPNGVEVELDFAPHEVPPANWKTLSSR
tara:strand:- start:111 stop:518 length:408 start_codon:yes stop_codon:yes gene_type:complete